MDETLQEQTERSHDIGWYLDVLRRRHMQFLISLLLGWFAVWSASWILPPTYKSNTLILVERPTMPKNYVEPNVSENLQERLDSITQQILSRTHLLSIIQKLNLYDRPGSMRTIDDKIVMMRKDIDIELVRDRQSDAISAFRIYYSARDPHVAQRVTSELTQLLIQENLQSRQQESEDTTKFLESQLASARESLADQEAKVREFQSRHEGELPTQQASNLQILSGLQSQLQNEQDALNTAKQQQAYFQAMIAQYRGLATGSQPLLNAGQGVSPLETINQELDKLRAQLADLRSRYTDRYPGVQALRDQIAATEILKQKLIAEQKDAALRSTTPGDKGDKHRMDEPTNAAMVQLEGQVESNRLEIANREESIAALNGRIGEYRARLNAEPATEQQLADLTRGYEQSQTNYDDLLKKESDSEMATSMERMQQGERFTILDPPSLPSKPDFPNRLTFSGVALVAGFGLAFVVVAAFEVFDDRLKSEPEIRALLPTAVIWDIPPIQNQQDLRKGKVRLALRWATGVFVLVAILAGSAFSYLHG